MQSAINVHPVAIHRSYLPVRTNVRCTATLQSNLMPWRSSVAGSVDITPRAIVAGSICRIVGTGGVSRVVARHVSCAVCRRSRPSVTGSVRPATRVRRVVAGVP